MSSIQFIERDGHREYAVVPMALFARLVEAVEDQEDLEELRRFRQEDDGFRIPGEIVFRMIEGENTIRLWREHRGLTLEALAERADISKAYLSQIENGKRAGTVKTVKALAAALEVPLDVLTS